MREFIFCLQELFVNPIYSASTIGSMLACVALSLIGVIYYIRKSALIGEVVAHSSFPGLVFGGFIAMVFGVTKPCRVFLYLSCALIASYLSMKKLHILQTKCKKSADASMMISISAFLAIGILLVSILQSMNPVIYKEVIIFLYGRAATMLSVHVQLYGFVTLLLVMFLVLFYEKIKILEFQRSFALFNFSSKKLDQVILALTLVIIIISLRTCGVLLIAGLMTTPAIASRCWVKKMSSMYILSALIGAISAIIGNYISLHVGGQNISLATGPVITVVASSIALFSLIFGSENGMSFRIYRKLSFSIRCQKEHVLKILYKKGCRMLVKELRKSLGAKTWTFIIALFLLRKKIHLTRNGEILLNEAGKVDAERIIRLHRLWEVYLYEVGFTKDRVHGFAEEIEHVISFEMEEILTKRLNNPTHCPHKQKIPERRGQVYDT